MRVQGGRGQPGILMLKFRTMQGVCMPLCSGVPYKSDMNLLAISLQAGRASGDLKIPDGQEVPCSSLGAEVRHGKPPALSPSPICLCCRFKYLSLGLCKVAGACTLALEPQGSRVALLPHALASR